VVSRVEPKGSSGQAVSPHTYSVLAVSSLACGDPALLHVGSLKRQCHGNANYSTIQIKFANKILKPPEVKNKEK
jgi:hypothetical protein